MTHLASIEDNPSDPTPRTYPPMVELLRRAHLDGKGPDPSSLTEVENWLLTGAVDEDDFLLVFQEFVWRLVAADLPIVRASLHVGTLHPQLAGYAWNWNSDDGFCDEVKVDEAALKLDTYKKNPLFRVIEYGECYRTLTNTPQALESPLLQDLQEKQITEYAAFPLRSKGSYHNAVTIATRQQDGFSNSQFAQIERLLRMLALHVERHIATRISENIVTTYLGSQAGQHVLNGSIKRGAGTPIDAVIWASDLRGFTDLADRLSERDLTAVMNAYFDPLVDAIMENGGEVLKFIGDGLLAVFPFGEFASRQDAAEAAISAAETALTRLHSLNEEEEALCEIEGWRPLRTGIALHCGEIFFGNVGSRRRLDFTVIGKAVNATNRVEGLCKSTGKSLLVSGEFKDLSCRDFVSLGQFDLRGLAGAVEVFSPVDPKAPQ